MLVCWTLTERFSKDCQNRLSIKMLQNMFPSFKCRDHFITNAFLQNILECECAFNTEMVILGAFYKEKVLLGPLRILNKLLCIEVKIGDPYYHCPPAPPPAASASPPRAAFVSLSLLCVMSSTRWRAGHTEFSTMQSYCHAVILSCCHAVILSYCHVVRRRRPRCTWQQPEAT